MNCHQSYVFLQDLSNSFHRWLNPLRFSFSRSISTIHGGSHHHSQHLKTEEGFLLNLVHSLEDSWFQLYAILIIVFDCDNSFLTIRSISWVVSISFLRRLWGHNSSFSACSYRSPNLTDASSKYPLISSWSLCSLVSKFSQASSFIC